MTARRSPRARLRRRYPRLTLRVDVTIEGPAGGFDAVATTLGAGGLFVATDRPLSLGTPLSVAFDLPGQVGSRLHFESRVVWSQLPGGESTAGMGLEFRDATARAKLAALLEVWAERYGAPPRSASEG